jgi:hypothetical protein
MPTGLEKETGHEKVDRCHELCTSIALSILCFPQPAAYTLLHAGVVGRTCYLEQRNRGVIAIVGCRLIPDLHGRRARIIRCTCYLEQRNRGVIAIVGCCLIPNLHNRRTRIIRGASNLKQRDGRIVAFGESHVGYCSRISKALFSVTQLVLTLNIGDWSTQDGRDGAKVDQVSELHLCSFICLALWLE